MPYSYVCGRFLERDRKSDKVRKYDDYMTYKTEAAVRAAGKMGIEGKDYVVQDGDIMHFLFNV